MSASIRIRNYRKSDREQCRSLWRELTEWHREIYQDPTIGGEHPENYFDKHLAKIESCKLWVAVSGSQVTGLIGLIVHDNEAEIEPLIVGKTHRGKGIGKQLINAVVSEAREIGVKYLCVKPVARNLEAITFLYNQGFQTLGQVELFVDFSNKPWKHGLELFGCSFNF